MVLKINQMKRKCLLIFVLLFIASMVSSCFDDQDDIIHQPSDLDNQNFVYRGLKQFYLYKSEDEVLDDDHFDNTEALHNYLGSFDSPESLFNSLLSDQDRFSVIVPDFHKLENQLNGITLNNGMEFGWVKISSTDEVFGYVRYVLPNTSAENQEVKRGMLFNRIDGIPLNTSNYSDLIQPNTYSIGLAQLNGNSLTSLEESITLTKTQYTEDPVYIHKTLDINGHKIGYLMYNGFTVAFDEELNHAFGDFKAEGITDLVIDLRYNPGGSIETSKDLASMITGQFHDHLFATEIYNDNYEDQELRFDDKISTGASINSLNFNKVYVITTSSTASASELLINGLNPYINLIQVGQNTVGKFQGSTTVYDSPNFTRNAVQPGHKYAMQPLILKTVNSEGFTDFVDGLTPDIEQREDFINLGQLGDPEEPLLHTIIQDITGGYHTTGYESASVTDYKQIGESKMNQLSYRRMYIDLK